MKIVIAFIIMLMLFFSGCGTLNDIGAIKETTEINLWENNRAIYAAGIRDGLMYKGDSVADAVDKAEELAQIVYPKQEEDHE